MYNFKRRKNNYCFLTKWSEHLGYFSAFCVVSAQWWICKMLFSAIVCPWPSTLMSTDFMVPLRGDWAPFCPVGSWWVGRVRPAREKSLKILRCGWELSWATDMTVRYVHCFTELSWLGPQRQQTMIYIHSPTEISSTRPWKGHTCRLQYTFILSLSYRDSFVSLHDYL